MFMGEDIRSSTDLACHYTVNLIDTFCHSYSYYTIIAGTFSISTGYCRWGKTSQNFNATFAN